MVGVLTVCARMVAWRCNPRILGDDSVDDGLELLQKTGHVARPKTLLAIVGSAMSNHVQLSNSIADRLRVHGPSFVAGPQRMFLLERL